MRVIGGPHDGRYYNIREGLDFIKLVDPLPPFSIKDDIPPGGEVVAPVDIKTTTYTVRQLRWPSSHGPDDFFFLAPHGWTDIQAIKHQFEK